MDNDLMFRSHAKVVVNKANRIVGMIRHAFTFMDCDMFRTLFSSLVRPHLEYGNVIWAPWYKKDIILIENVQRRATKLVSNIRNYSYVDRLKKLNLPSLTYRRLRGDLIEVYKYIYSYYCTEQLLQINRSSTTRGHSLKITKQHCKSNVRLRFFSLRVTNTWNNLPNSVVSAPSLNTFKNRLDAFYGERKFYVGLE